MTRKSFIIGTWLTAFILAGLLFLAYRMFMSSVPEVFRADTFTHPEYGFTLTVPAGMQVRFERYTISKPSYDSIGLYYPSVTGCPANADCMFPREVRVSVWKVEGTQSFAQLLAEDTGYGAYLREAQTLDGSQYTDQNGWTLYRGPNAAGEEVRFAYSIARQVLLKFENTQLQSTMESVIQSLR